MADKRAVGSFVDPKTGQRIDVFPKRGETKREAINRVAHAHGIDPAKVDVKI